MTFFGKLFFGSLFLAIFGWSATASAQADFYKGKTITVYIGTTPGALYDQWGRILAMHMSKHIPGKPDIIVQNMPGAGHMIAANYVYKTTKPDGLSLIGSIVPTLYFNQLVGRKEAQYDWAKFVWIGSPVQGESQMYMRATRRTRRWKTCAMPRSHRAVARKGLRIRRTICRSFSKK
jgi:tripartite-type tricarboxylate transporter receptor subunit TctC